MILRSSGFVICNISKYRSPNCIRILVVISDGLPYGYENISLKLKEEIDKLVKKGVIVIGIGVETERMKNYFRINAAVHNQKDLIKRFAKIFVKASVAALES